MRQPDPPTARIELLSEFRTVKHPVACGGLNQLPHSRSNRWLILTAALFLQSDENISIMIYMVLGQRLEVTRPQERVDRSEHQAPYTNRGRPHKPIEITRGQYNLAD